MPALFAVVAVLLAIQAGLALSWGHVIDAVLSLWLALVAALGFAWKGWSR